MATKYKLTWLADNDTFIADDAAACFAKAAKWAGWKPGWADTTGFWNQQDGTFYGGYFPEEDRDGKDTRFTIEPIAA